MSSWLGLDRSSPSPGTPNTRSSPTRKPTSSTSICRPASTCSSWAPRRPQSNTLPPADMPMPPRALMEGLSKDYGGLPLTQDRSTRPNPDAAATPAVTSAATADAYWHAGGRWAVLASGTSTGGSYCMFEVIMPQNAEITPHLRDDVDEVFFVLEGSADMLLDDRIEPMTPGSMAFAPRGTVAALRVTSAAARLLIIHTGPGYERVLACFGAKAATTGLPGAGCEPLAISEQRVRNLHADIGLRRVIATNWSTRLTTNGDATSVA